MGIKEWLGRGRDRSDDRGEVLSEVLAGIDQLASRGRLSEALALARGALARFSATKGASADETLQLQVEVAALENSCGAPTAALPIAEAALQAIQQLGGAHDRLTYSALARLAEIHRSLRNWEQASVYDQRGFALAERVFPTDSTDFAVAVIRAANHASRSEEWRAAESLYKRAWLILAAGSHGGEEYLFPVAGGLAYVYEKMGDARRTSEWAAERDRLRARPLS